MIAQRVADQSDTTIRHFCIGKCRGKVQRPGELCVRSALLVAEPSHFDEVIRTWCEDIDVARDVAMAPDIKSLVSSFDKNNRQVPVLGASAKTHVQSLNACSDAAGAGDSL